MVSSPASAGRHLVATSALADAAARRRVEFILSYHNCRPGHRLEGLAQALDPWIDPVGGAEIEDEHVIVAANGSPPPGAAPSRRAAARSADTGTQRAAASNRSRASGRTPAASAARR